MNQKIALQNKNRLFLLVFIFHSIIVNAQIPTNGLTGYWPFSKAQLANDYSGYGNNGTIHGAALTTDRFGNCNQAYKFDGVSNYIEVPHSSTIDMYNTDFTIAVWEKTYINDTIGPILQKHIHTGAWEGYSIITNDNDPGYCPMYKHAFFYVAAAAHQEVCTDNPICNDTSWHFLTGVYKYSSNQYYLYIDGVLQSSVGTGTGNTSNSVSLVFGGGGGTFFTGVLDAIRIYKRALSANEISQLYYEPNPGPSLSGIMGMVKDTSICTSASAILNAGSALSYTWSTGSNNQTININSQGTYWVQIQQQSGCKVTDTIHASFTLPPIIKILKDTNVCSNVNYVLNASQANATHYIWSTGVTSSYIVPTYSGNYWVNMQIGLCFVKDSAQINFLSPPLFNLIKDTVICNTPILLDIGDSSLSSIWSNGSHSNQTIINSVGIYSVSVSNKNGCITKSTINIENTKSIEPVIVPNIVTPNEDGINDVFEFKTDNLNVLEFNIYNRWGKLVYTIQNTSVYWDCKFADDGTYYWTALFSSTCNSSLQSIKQKGFLTVLK